MTTKVINDKKYSVLFKHSKLGDVRRCTVAFIINEETREVAVGVSIVNPKDQYVKALGRKISEGRAVKALSQPVSDMENLVANDLCANLGKISHDKFKSLYYASRISRLVENGNKLSLTFML